jgi:hypothetical protein
MRDDRYRGTTSRDRSGSFVEWRSGRRTRAHPERLLQQAVVAFVSEADREISPEFRRRLREHDAAPTLFGVSDLAESARNGLEVEIARSIEAGQGVDSKDAICEALRLRGESYSREQKCNLIADRHPYASIALGSVKKACNEAAAIAAGRILDGGPAPRMDDSARLNEDLLIRPSSGASP